MVLTAHSSAPREDFFVTRVVFSDLQESCFPESGI